jgi:peptidylprolyl isomerase
MTSTKQILIVIASSVLLVGLLAWWGTAHPQNELLLEQTDENFQAPLTPEEQDRLTPANVNTMNPVAVIDTTMGTIELELFRDEMPVTAGNFITLAEGGFYDGTKFHRVIENFMIQGGDPNSKTENEATWGTGGPGYAIADEHIAGEKLTNVRGTIAMANSGPNTGGSQFFINLVDNTYLDFDKEPLSSKHPVFGRVIAGMDVVDAIGQVETKPGDRPVDPVVVNSVTIREATGE